MRYHVTHDVRPYGAIGIFAPASRIIYAPNKMAALDQAREQWHVARHETMHGHAVLTRGGKVPEHKEDLKQ